MGSQISASLPTAADKVWHSQSEQLQWTSLDLTSLHSAKRQQGTDLCVTAPRCVPQFFLPVFSWSPKSKTNDYIADIRVQCPFKLFKFRHSMEPRENAWRSTASVLCNGSQSFAWNQTNRGAFIAKESRTTWQRHRLKLTLLQHAQMKPRFQSPLALKKSLYWW